MLITLDSLSTWKSQKYLECMLDTKLELKLKQQNNKGKKNQINNQSSPKICSKCLGPQNIPWKSSNPINNVGTDTSVENQGVVQSNNNLQSKFRFSM